MQRSICLLAGACGLIFTFSVAAQTGGAASGASGGTATAGAATTGASGGARIGAAGGTASAAAAGRTVPATGAGQNVSATPGQNVSTVPGQSVSTIPGQSVSTTPPTFGAQGQPGVATPGSATATTGTTAGTAGATTTTLPGTTTPIAGTTATTSGTSVNGNLPGTFGFVAGTPYAFDQLPVPVQTAMTAQGAAGVTNVTFTPLGNGGVFRAMVDGKPVEVLMAANGQILPNRALAAATSNITTNALTIEDVPVAVRDAVRTSAPFAEVSRISKSTTASGDVYDITMRANDRLTMMQVAENGTVIKENHDLAAAVRTDASAIRRNEPPKLAWNSLPVAVRDSIEVHARADAVKTLALTNYLGKTAYVVDYVDQDALRNRLYINKEGLVVDTQTNIFGIATTGKPVVIDDLPGPARATVQQQAENSAVTRIDMAMYGLTPVYVVTYQRDGEARQMVVSREGRRMDASVGAPAATVIGSEKGRSEAESKATEPK